MSNDEMYEPEFEVDEETAALIRRLMKMSRPEMEAWKTTASEEEIERVGEWSRMMSVRLQDWAMNVHAVFYAAGHKLADGLQSAALKTSIPIQQAAEEVAARWNVMAARGALASDYGMKGVMLKTTRVEPPVPLHLIFADVQYTERPISLTAEELKALRDGRRAILRRPVVLGLMRQRNGYYAKWPERWHQEFNMVAPAKERGWVFWNTTAEQENLNEFTQRVYPEGNLCPYGDVGDVMWVRETFAYLWPDLDREYEKEECQIEYRAEGDPTRYPGDWPPESKGDPDKLHCR